jgi:serine phosphatase RsbU (regulator of sigma subunit)
MPLGVLPGIVFERFRHTLAPGDRLLLTTDGLSDQRRSVSEDRYGIARVIELMERHRAMPIELWLRFLVRAVEDWCGAALPDDDMTAVLVEVSERGAPPA